MFLRSVFGGPVQFTMFLTTFFSWEHVPVLACSPCPAAGPRAGATSDLHPGVQATKGFLSYFSGIPRFSLGCVWMFQNTISTKSYYVLPGVQKNEIFTR